MNDRELKFRFWNGEQMILPRDLQVLAKNLSHPHHMQYTGLKDKTGRDIYEGDIVFVDTEWMRHIGGTARYSLVGFNNGCFMFGRRANDPWFLDTYLWMSAGSMEVVGHIYTHPYLLGLEYTNEQSME